jgi:parvulin-like peptidyl-prolyl cis-trans isomerase-like protein
MKKLLPLLALIILFAWGCGQSEKKEETKKATTSTQETTTEKKVVARIDGRPIYQEDLKGRPLNQVIDYEILYEVGLKKGLDKKLEDMVQDYKKRLIITSVERGFMNNLPKGGEVTDKEIEDYYKENQNNYKILSLKQIVTDDKNLAEEIHKRALNGEDFEKISSDLSKSGKAITLRNLTFNRRYNDLFNEKPVGSVSEVIQEGNQFVILKLTEMQQLPLDRAKQAVRIGVLAKRRTEALHENIEKLKNENKINVEVIEEKR